MPVVDVIPSDPSEAGLDHLSGALQGTLHRLLKESPERALKIGVERRNRGPASGPIGNEVDVSVEAGEDPAELAREATDRVVALIRRDAMRPRVRQGARTPNGGMIGPWQGEVIVFDADPRAKKPELKKLPITIDDPEEDARLDTETVAVINVVRLFLKDMCHQMTGMMSAAKDVAQANADMADGVMKRMAQESITKGKYDWKLAKLKAELFEERMQEDARTERTRVWSSALAEIATKYQPVVEFWSRWMAEDMRARREGGKRPTEVRPPTQDELTKVFGGDEKLDTLHSFASQMIAERNRDHRIELARNFRMTLEDLPAEERFALQARAVQALGEPRARECYAWLAMPVTDP